MVTIRNRWTNEVMAEAEDLRGIVWRDRVLRSADISESDLSGSDLSGSDLFLADFRKSDLSNANLRNANLRNADFSNSCLYGADLSDTDLRGANFSGCELIGADLRDVDVINVNLAGADLSKARNVPLLINGLRWPVQISGTGWMAVGCEKHLVSEWADFDDERISAMEDGALDFWRAYKPMLMALCEQWKHPEEEV